MLPALKIAAIAAATLLTSCTSHYHASLRDLARSSERRMAMRLDAMEQSADRALRAVERAAEASREKRPAESASDEARRIRLMNDASAAVFEYSRQVLIVDDAMAQADPDAVARLEPLRASMLAAEESLLAAMEVVYAREGVAPASEEHRAGALSRRVERAAAHIGEVARSAQTAMAENSADAPPPGSVRDGDPVGVSLAEPANAGEPAT